MKRNGESRTSGSNSTPSMLRPVSMLSRAGAIVIPGLLLLSALWATVQGQTTALSIANTGQNQAQSWSGSSPFYPPDLPRGSVISSERTQPPSSISAAVPGKSSAVTQRLNRASGMSNKVTFSTLCFQPGVGWMQRPLPVDTASHAFQTAPSQLLARAAKARRLIQPADSEDCEVSSPSVDASLGAILAGSNFGSMLSGQSMGNAMSNSATVSHQSGILGSSSTSSRLNSQTTPTSVLSQQGLSGLSYSYFQGLASPSISIWPSISPTGDLEFSIAFAEQGADDEETAAEGTLVKVPIYSFAPGTDSAGSRSVSGNKASHVTWSTLESERNSVIGYKSERLKSQEDSAATEAPVLAKDLHAYRQLRNFCLQVVEMQEAGDVSDLLDTQVTRGRNATELTRLRQDCSQFLAMGRDAAIRKMQKHQGLK